MVILKIDLISPLLTPLTQALQARPLMVTLTPLAMFPPARGFIQGLFRQMNLVIEDPKKRLIAGHFVNALETSGWIGMTVEEVADASGSSVEEADAVLTTLQTFEPTGLFARDLADCLRLQLIEMGQ